MSSGELSGGTLRRLLCLKAAALLHDPPNKMWAIRSRLSHSELARELARRVLEGTALEGCLDEVTEDALSLVDGLVASYDRWVLLTSGRAGGYLWYDYVHNIFDSSRRRRLEIPPGVDVLEAARAWAGEVNKRLRLIEERAGRLEGDKAVAATYNSLYLLLETTWYKLGLPPSLADTRSPTHTVFDHLYAAASISNAALGGTLGGYYVVIDFPGIQRFIAGRKAGDLWVSSWMLSNLVWRVSYGIAETLGLDIILTPTPRLNPYSFKGLAATLSGRSIYAVRCADGPAELCELASSIYGTDGPAGVERLWSQPLVPATLTMILPRLYSGSAREVADDMVRRFGEAWRELEELVVERLTSQASRGDALSKYLLSYVQSARNVLVEPPQGLSVAVVELERVHSDLKRCLVESDREVCERVGLAVDRGRLEKVAKDFQHPERLLEDLSRRLVYHVVVTRWASLAASYGVLVSSVPRAFWYYSQGSDGLTAVGAFDTEVLCSTCGEEPAVLRTGKVFRRAALGFEVGYSEETLEDVRSRVGPIDKRGEQELMKYLKPGEALGPYCLFKRATYHALRDLFGPVSTDDVALMRISRVLNERFKDFLDRLVSSLESKAEVVERFKAPKELLEALYAYGRGRLKDIEELARAYGMGYDEFASYLRGALARACVEAFGKDVDKLINFAIELLGIPRDEVGGLVGLVLGTPGHSGVAAGKLCDLVLPPTSYAIVRGDADDIGKLLSGRPAVGLNEFVGTLLKHLKEDGEGPKGLLAEVEKSYRDAVEIAEAVGLEGVPVSPAWHSAVSLSLVLTAVDDLRITESWDGFLVYSGGDDILALLPVQTAIRAARDLREAFTGDYFKKVHGVLVTSSIATGRSFSIRFSSLKDLMGEEMAKAMELLESRAKKVEWILGGRPKVKDSLVISDSRSEAVALLPNFVDCCGASAHGILLRLALSLAAGIISGNLPEDLEEFTERSAKRVAELLSPDELKAVVEYVLRRNIAKSLREHSDRVVELISADIYGVQGKIGKTGEVVLLPIELYGSATRVMRRHL